MFLTKAILPVTVVVEEIITSKIELFNFQLSIHFAFYDRNLVNTGRQINGLFKDRFDIKHFSNSFRNILKVIQK